MLAFRVTCYLPASRQLLEAVMSIAGPQYHTDTVTERDSNLYKLVGRNKNYWVPHNGHERSLDDHSGGWS